MRSAKVFFQNNPAGMFQEIEQNASYIFRYENDYSGPPISLLMPVGKREFSFNRFPPFFDGLLPEGGQLEGLLKLKKIDKNDLFGQLIAVGHDLVGAVTVEEIQ